MKYRYDGTYNQSDIIVASEAITDLLMIYGNEIFGEEVPEDEPETTRRTVRTLYDESQIEVAVMTPPINTTFADYIQTLTDMLDDVVSSIEINIFLS